MAGYTDSADFSTTAGAYDTSFNGGPDAFLGVFDSTLSRLSYATFLGGSAYEWGEAITLDEAGNAYVTGPTESADFPATAGVYDTSFNGYEDVFLAVLDPTLSRLSYATFLGGSDCDRGHAIALDRGGQRLRGGVHRLRRLSHHRRGI